MQNFSPQYGLQYRLPNGRLDGVAPPESIVASMGQSGVVTLLKLSRSSEKWQNRCHESQPRQASPRLHI